MWLDSLHLIGWRSHDQQWCQTVQLGCDVSVTVSPFTRDYYNTIKRRKVDQEVWVNNAELHLATIQTQLLEIFTGVVTMRSWRKFFRVWVGLYLKHRMYFHMYKTCTGCNFTCTGCNLMYTVPRKLQLHMYMYNTNMPWQGLHWLQVPCPDQIWFKI